MHNNPYPDEPKRVRPTDVLSQRPPAMEDLPPKPAPPQPAAAPIEMLPVVESVERQEEARTVRYAISKLNDFLQWFLVVMEVTLIIRFFFLLIGAQHSNLFAVTHNFWDYTH